VVRVSRLLVILMTLLVPTVSTTLAHIDPPDPTWAGGYWDDDDFDYAVDAILHHAAVPPTSPTAADPSWITVARLEILEVNGVAPPVPSIDSPRGPPAPSSSRSA
jgi:hypothetical protein